MNDEMHTKDSKLSISTSKALLLPCLTELLPIVDVYERDEALAYATSRPSSSRSTCLALFRSSSHDCI